MKKTKCTHKEMVWEWKGKVTDRLLMSKIGIIKYDLEYREKGRNYFYCKECKQPFSSKEARERYIEAFDQKARVKK